MHDLVYIKCNQQLTQRYDIRDEIDPILLNDIDECNEWLVGEVDDDNNNEDEGNELVFDDDLSLYWATVYEASGIEELVVYTRRQTTNKRKQSSSGGIVIQSSSGGIVIPSSSGAIVIGSSHTSKKGSGATLTPTQPKKGKEKTQIQVQNELHDSSDSEFERLLNFDRVS